MQATLLLASSVPLQFVAAALALRPIRITGGRWAWSLIATAVALMAVRRSITLTRVLTDHGSLKPDLWAELAALVISILMVAGLTAVGPLFESIKRSQEAREASQQRFRNLVDTVDAIVWESDLTRRRSTYVNQRAEALLGHSVDAWTQETDFWADHLHPDDRDAAVAYCRSRTKEAEDHELEYRAIAADGSTVWLSDSVRIVVDIAGGPVGLRGVMIDISARKSAETDRKRLEQELRQSQKMEALGTLDVYRPKKNGPACLAEIHKTHAHVPVVISTGNVDFELDQSLADQAMLIRKPFRMSQSTELVLETLDRAALETGG